MRIYDLKFLRMFYKTTSLVFSISIRKETHDPKKTPLTFSYRTCPILFLVSSTSLRYRDIFFMLPESAARSLFKNDKLTKAILKPLLQKIF